MKRYKVYHSAWFDKELAGFNLDFQNRVDKIEDQLVENPYVGNPLSAENNVNSIGGGYGCYLSSYY